MVESITLVPAAGTVHFVVRPPGSKSLTNRGLLCAGLAEGSSLLRGALASDDTRYMIDALRELGLSVEWEGADLRVAGAGGRFPNQTAELFVGNSGTTIRFLTAALAMMGGHYRLDGVPRMRERPIGDLVDALVQLGARVKAESPGGCPPVQIDSARLPGGNARVGGVLSSQYLSGLLMAAPLATGPIELSVTGPLVSEPYVAMTIEVMRQFGGEVDVDLEKTGQGRPAAGEASRVFRVRPGAYRGLDYDVEPDASAASYFWALPAICGGRGEVAGLSRDSLQGDVRFVDALSQMGCQVSETGSGIAVTGPAQRGIDIDMGEMSDTVQTLSAVALFVDGPTRIRGVAHNRIKETDRIGNLASELRKLGARVEEWEDGLTIHPGELHPATLETWDDHRMAMSFALIAARQEGVEILGPGCVAKTYPRFFEDLEKVLRTGPR